MIQLTPHCERGGCRGYDSVAEREADIRKLESEGFDHFVPYRDSDAPIALSYGKRQVSKDNPENSGEIRRHWTPKPGDRGYDLLC